MAELSSPLDIKTVLKNTFMLARTHRLLADLSHDQKTNELLLADGSSKFS